MELLRLKKKEINYLNLSKGARQMRTIEFENYINLDKMTIKHDVINKFKENNYEFLINHEKYEITIRDIKLEKDFIILKFAPIVELR